MGNKLKDMIKLIMSPIIFQMAKRWGGNYPTELNYLSGDYLNWDEAMAASEGYDSKIILEKTKAALLKVKNGEAVYERDSVLFDKIQYSWPILAGLMWVAARFGGRLNVLDFGGSLGTTYFQNRIFLSTLPKVRWNIVEQAHHVETGKIWFEDDRLRFYMSIADCLADTQPNVVHLGSVLQYLPMPHVFLSDLQRLPSDYIIIDRTPFWDGQNDKLCVQTVSPNIYPASYPSWIFSFSQFCSRLEKDWEIVEDFECISKLKAPVTIDSNGFILVRKHPRVDIHSPGE
jgi:putative methyltransferase (TIGR04325 family)